MDREATESCRPFTHSQTSGNLRLLEGSPPEKQSRGGTASPGRADESRSSQLKNEVVVFMIFNFLNHAAAPVLKFLLDETLQKPIFRFNTQLTLMTGFLTKWSGGSPFELLRNSIVVCRCGHLVLFCVSQSVCNSSNHTLWPDAPPPPDAPC